MLPFEPTSPRRLGALLYTCMVCALMALGGISCGQRGPLYLPDSKPAVSSPAMTDPQAEETQGEASGTDTEAVAPEQDEEDDEEAP